MKKSAFFGFLFSAILWSCTNGDSLENGIDPSANTDDWVVPTTEIRGGGETFGLMNTPKFKSVQETTSLQDTSKVTLVSFNNEVRVYPYHYTNFFEVVNDVFDGKNIAVSFCPITNSAICFDRTIDTKTYDFVASGYLYKYNMVPADKNLDFFYSQMLMTGIKGEYANTQLNQYNLVETVWGTVRQYFPNAKVFYHNETKSTKQGKSDDIKPVEDGDYYYGVLNSVKGEKQVDLYAYEDFSEPINAVIKIINQQNAILIGSESKRIFATYYIPENKTLTLLSDAEFPNVLTDNTGTIYSIFGYAVSGPDQGSQLESPQSIVAQHWAWKDFYPKLVYQ